MKNFHTKTIAAGVLPICIETGRILLNRRGMHQDHPGEWSTWGGKFDEDDIFAKNTAKREFKEETGYDGDYEISIMPFHICSTNHKNFYLYLSIHDVEFIPDIQSAGEAMDWGWFKLHELPDVLHDKFKEMIEEKRDKLSKVIEVHKKKYLEEIRKTIRRSLEN